MVAQESLDVAVNSLVERFIADNPKVAAKRLERLPRTEAAAILVDLPASQLTPIWEAFLLSVAAELLALLPVDRAVDLIQSTESGRNAHVLSIVDENARNDILSALAPKLASELRELMSYPPDSAGNLMDTRALTFRGEMTVEEAAQYLRFHRPDRTVYELRLVDDENRLKSIVDIKDLALADHSQTLDSIAHGIVAFVSPMDPRSEIVEKLELFRLDELAVIDHERRLVGVIRHAELIEALKDTATIDMQTMVGVSKDERATSSSWFAVRKRMPWLQINLITAFMAASVVGLFEATIAQFTALAVLLPVVAGQSGNTGAQALAVTMRGLALREIRIRDWLKVTRKEVNAGFWNGVSIAVTCGIGVFIWSGQIGLVLVISSSMIIAMVLAGLAGALVPITLTRLGQDPAVASSILLTTVTDIAGFFSFLGIATLLSGMLT